MADHWAYRQKKYQLIWIHYESPLLALNLHQNSSSDGFWPQKNTCEVLAPPSTSWFRNKKQTNAT